MAQRETWAVPPMEQVEVDKALARIGLGSRDPFQWDALHWFVQFAQRDLTGATEGDWLLLSEEVHALLHLVSHQQLRAGLHREQLRDFQADALKVLTGLVDTNEAAVGPFTVQVFIRRGIGQASDPSKIKRLGPLVATPSGPFAGIIGPDGTAGLLYHLAALLMRWPDTVQRCPKCHQLFARFRSHAEFCSRKCQSQVAASEGRIAAKAEKERAAKGKTARSQQEPRSKKSAKGARHGKTTR